jgi:hypothetical protein
MIYGLASGSPIISTSTCLPDSTTLIIPSNGAIIAAFFGFLISNNSSILLIPCVISASTHASVLWKVRIVSCVPGSPIDCDEIIPTGLPTSTSFLVERSIPKHCWHTQLGIVHVSGERTLTAWHSASIISSTFFLSNNVPLVKSVFHLLFLASSARTLPKRS